MGIPTKLRLLHAARKICPEWAIERQAIFIEHAFDSDLAATKNGEARQEIIAQRDFEAGEYWEELAEFRTRKLVSRAQRLHIPLDDLKWRDGNHGNRYLDNASEYKLYSAIREDRRTTWELRIKIITVVVTALTGLAGAAIGLVAIWKK
jgi:hypothetical protein